VFLLVDFSLYDAIASSEKESNVIPKRPPLNVQVKS